MTTREAPPRVFAVFCDAWDVPRPLQRAWWHALSRATQPPACEWRQKLLLFHATRLLEPRRLLHTVCSPGETVKVLEALVGEGRLERRMATTIEECLLHYTNKKGAWYGGRAQH